MQRRLMLASALLLVVSACGGDSGTVTTVTTVAQTSTTTTTTEAPTTTVPLGSGSPLSVGIGQMFEDPFFDSGFHEMAWVDEQEILLSTTSLTNGPGDFLAVARILPPPTTSGVAASGQLLVEAYVDLYSGDIIPSAIVLYTEEPAGWTASAVIDQGSIETVLLGMTDYTAVAPGGPVVIQTNVSAFDWVARTFRAEVIVSDYFDGYSLVYAGELECIIADPLECTNLSDDGILRQGDQGEAVEMLQTDLAALGYLGGVIDGKYGPGTAAAVRAFQTDFWLGVDGTAGPETLGLIADVLAGTSDLVLASPDRIGAALFGTPAEAAYATLFNIFGPPQGNTGWYNDGCDGHDWLKATWRGFTAIFTDRNGFRQLDGWEVLDLSNLPDPIRIAGGIRPTWKWSDFEAAGAEFDPFYGGFFYMVDLSYNNGRFVLAPSDPPAANALVRGFGTGTGAFVSC